MLKCNNNIENFIKFSDKWKYKRIFTVFFFKNENLTKKVIDEIIKHCNEIGYVVHEYVM